MQTVVTAGPFVGKEIPAIIVIGKEPHFDRERTAADVKRGVVGDTDGGCTVESHRGSQVRMKRGLIQTRPAPIRGIHGTPQGAAVVGNRSAGLVKLEIGQGIIGQDRIRIGAGLSLAGSRSN